MMLPTEPGDYTVTVGQSDDGPIVHEFEGVVFEHADDGLRVIRAGTRQLVAQFRWWDSIVAKTADDS